MILICPMASIGVNDSPFTLNKPKAMLKVAGKFVIDHLIEKLMQTFPKRTKLCLIVGYKKHIICRYITDKYSDYFDLLYFEQKPIKIVNEMPIFSGLGDAIALASDFGSLDDCLFFLGDMLPPDNFDSLIETFNQEKYDGVINVQKVPDPHFYGACKINKNNIIEKIIEKPREFISDWIVAGAYCFSKKITPKLFNYLMKQAEDKNFLEKRHDLTPIIQNLISEQYKIGVNKLDSPILDFGRIKPILEGNQRLLQKSHSQIPEDYVERGCKLEESKIIPPIFIGKNVILKNSIIGPNVSIGDNVTITKSIISESIIGDNSNLNSITTTNSVIGDYVDLESLVKNNIVIGDSSIISSIEK